MSPKDDARGGASWVRIAIQRPVTVSVLVTLVVLFGFISVRDIPIQLTPDIEVPTLSVRTSWPGAAPTEVETEILLEQEDVLKGIDGLERMESEAEPGSARLTLELEVGSDIDEALVRVTNRLSQVRSYPIGAREPVVSTSDSTGPPLAVLAVRSDDGSPPAAYRTWVEDAIIPQLERIPGISEARLIGGRDRELHVDFDPVALAARRLTLSDVARRIGANLRDVSGGDLTLGKRRYLVRTPVAPADPAELERVVLGADADGTPILLGDVADVEMGLRKPEDVAWSDDRPSLVLLLSREAGTNVLEVTREVRATVDRLQRDSFAPEGLSLEVLSDQVDYIQGSLDLVQQNLLLGAFLAIVVLVLFLRSFGASAIIALSIPFCVFSTALGMSLLGRTVNVVSLAGVTFAVGMVLDNSIVALENIDTWRGRAASPDEAAFHGVREIWGALLASTLTTAIVFVPIVLWQGEVGELLRDIAIAMCLAVGSSLVVSVIVIPSFAARLLRVRRASSAAPSALARFGARLRSSMGAQVRWLSRGTTRPLAATGIAVSGALVLAWALLPPLEYLPTGNRNLIFAILSPPPGYSAAELERVGASVQHDMAAHTRRRVGGVPPIGRSFFVGDSSRVFAGATAENPDEVSGVLDFIRSVHARIPGMMGFSTQASLFGRHLGGGRSMELEIAGGDLDTLSEVGTTLMGSIAAELPGAQVRPIPSLDPGAPELHAVPRRDEAAALGMEASELGLVVDALVDGAFVGELGREGEPKVDVILRAARGEDELVETPAGLASAPVATPSGRVVPLAQLAEIEETLGPTVIQRIERRRAISLLIAPPDDVPLEVAIDRVRANVIGPMERDGSLPAGVDLRLTGTAGKLEVARDQFAGVLGLAVLITFLLLAALYEDFLAPIAVMVTVPLAAAGGMLALRLVDRFLGEQQLDLMTALGFLILIGVVVNNAILVVDGALARLREGDELEDAVARAVESRVRPIFMTTTTSLAGLLPMVLFPGAGSELYRGIGAIVLGGLALSTVLTVYVVPSLFAVLWRARYAVRRARTALASAPSESPAAEE